MAGASAVQVVRLDVGGNLGLPLVPVAEQLLLVVQQLLVRLGGELEVGALWAGAGVGAVASGPSAGPLPQPLPNPRPAHLDDGVHRASLLAEAAVDALRHVDVVAGGPAAAISPRLSLDGDGLGEGHQEPLTAGSCPFLGARSRAVEQTLPPTLSLMSSSQHLCKTVPVPLPEMTLLSTHGISCLRG